MKELLAKIVSLDSEKADLEARLKDVKQERSGIEEELKGKFEETGIDSVKFEGRTVYLQRQLWARPVNGATDVFKEHGMMDMVKESINVQTLSAWVRELEANDEEIPSYLVGSVNVEEIFQIRTRKAN